MMNYISKAKAITLVLILSGLAPTLVLATDNPSEQANLELVLRQLEMIERVAQRNNGAPVQDDSARYHFDYAQLQNDLELIRQGIRGYLAPSRAQPRDLKTLSGHYTRTGSSSP